MRVALFEDSANFGEFRIFCEKDGHLELYFVFEKKFSDCLLTQFNRNKTFNEQDAYNDWVFFT